MTDFGKLAPYKHHPLVRNIEDKVPNILSQECTDVLKVEDLLISGIRDTYRDGTSKSSSSGRDLNPGAFSGTIRIARGLACIDTAHITPHISEFAQYVIRVTPTNRNISSIRNNVNQDILPLLQKMGIVVTDEQNLVTDVMPYPVASRYYVQEQFLNNQKLRQNQENHFTIVKQSMDFPTLKNEIKAGVHNNETFTRDYAALQDYDIIRPAYIRGNEYVFTKDYITRSEEARKTFEIILDSTDTLRLPYRDIMTALGNCGGFMTSGEVSAMTGLTARATSHLLRLTDKLGLGKLSCTMDMTDAIVRPMTGTLLNRNYLEFENAASILPIVRYEESAAEILNMLVSKGMVGVDDLYTMELPSLTIERVGNALKKIGILDYQGYLEGNYVLVKNKEAEEFLRDVLTVHSGSRRVIPPERDSIPMLDSFKDRNMTDLEKSITKLQAEFGEIQTKDYKQ